MSHVLEDRCLGPVVAQYAASVRVGFGHEDDRYPCAVQGEVSAANAAEQADGVHQRFPFTRRASMNASKSARVTRSFR
jgi:hypothetical protein